MWNSVYIKSNNNSVLIEGCPKLKKTASKITIVLSVIFFVVSICPITSMECFKGKVPLQDTIKNSTNIIYGITYGDMSNLPHKQNNLFYIGLTMVIMSSILCFEKSNKFKGLISVVLSIFLVLFVIITHNYLWFLILLNLYFLASLVIDFTLKNKIIIVANIIGAIICVLNIFQLRQHLQLIFDPNNIQTFQMELIELSDNTLKILTLWLIPYTILLIKHIAIIYKSSRTVN